MYLSALELNFPLVPEGAPQSVQAQALNDTFIAVTWLPPLLSLQNGRIFGYKIYYMKHKDTIEFGEEYVLKLYGDSIKVNTNLIFIFP